MEKTKEISVALDGLAECGHGLVKIAEALKRYYAGEPPKKKAAPKKKDEPPAEPEAASPPVEEATTETKPEYTKEYVRKILSAAANNGHREEVKAIIQKHGANSLSQIDPSQFESIVKEAEVLGSA